jgi:hypothetical protein
VTLVPGSTDIARVVWASGDAPSGDVFDVQVEVPGSSWFADWRTGITSLQGDFGPSDPFWAGPGTYRFRARLRQRSSGAASGYSAAKSVPFREDAKRSGLVSIPALVARLRLLWCDALEPEASQLQAAGRWVRGRRRRLRSGRSV